jgi:hypothetical protein
LRTTPDAPFLPKLSQIYTNKDVVVQDLEVGLQPTEAAKEAGFVDDTRPDHKAKTGKVLTGLERWASMTIVRSD